MLISSLLAIGHERPTSGKQLAEALGCDIREVTAAIERERRAGSPICANDAGYFLAANKEEGNRYARRLNSRIKNLNKTYRSFKKTIDQLPDE